jgi:NADH-quinone oxidoreductase subunit N
MPLDANSLIPTIEWAALWPVVAVIGTGVVALIVEMLQPRRNNNLVASLSIAGLVAAGWLIALQLPAPSGETVGGMFLEDRLGLLLQLVMLGSAALCFLFSEPYLREKGAPFAEFYPLALWSLAGGMLMVATTDLLIMFLGLELLSISLYCLAGMSRNEARSEESAMKYFLLGSFATAFFLMGVAFVFGATGSLNLTAFAQLQAGASSENVPFAVLGLAFLLVGLGFKLALVPFHQWTPDVYQGAPTNVTAFMAAVSKVAAVGALVRVLWYAQAVQDVWFPILWALAIATMCVGNFAALVQTDVKRTLAYSSIAHAGYLLVGLLAAARAPEKVSLAAVVFYLASYAAMTVGAFAVVSLTASQGQENTRFHDVRGLWRRAPWAAGCLVVFLCSLIGIPLTGGFFGKLLIFQSALDAGLITLAVVLAVNSAVSAYYYLGILRAAFVAEEGAVPARIARPSYALNLACTLCLAAVLATGLAAGTFLTGLGLDGSRFPSETDVSMPQARR